MKYAGARASTRSLKVETPCVTESVCGTPSLAFDSVQLTSVDVLDAKLGSR